MGFAHVQLLPFLAKYYVMPFEWDMYRNARALRNFCSRVIERRREEIRKDPSLAKKGDFLTMLVTEEHFKDRNERVIDECLTFFFAGS